MSIILYNYYLIGCTLTWPVKAFFIQKVLSSYYTSFSSSFIHSVLPPTSVYLHGDYKILIIFEYLVPVIFVINSVKSILDIWVEFASRLK